MDIDFLTEGEGVACLSKELAFFAGTIIPENREVILRIMREFYSDFACDENGRKGRSTGFEILGEIF